MLNICKRKLFARTRRVLCTYLKITLKTSKTILNKLSFCYGNPCNVYSAKKQDSVKQLRV